MKSDLERGSADQGVWPDLPLCLLESAEWAQLCPVLIVPAAVTPKPSWPELGSAWCPSWCPSRCPSPVPPGQDQTPELLGSQAGSSLEGHRGSAQCQGGQGLLLSRPHSPQAWRAAHKGLFPLPCASTGDSAVIPTVPGSVGSTGWVSGHLGGGSPSSSQCVQVVPIAGHPPWQERPQCTHPVSKDVASAGAGDELAHTRSPAQEGPAWHTRFQQRFSPGSLHGPNSLPGMEQGIPSRMEGTCLAQAVWKGKRKAGGSRAGQPCPEGSWNPTGVLVGREAHPLPLFAMGRDTFL